MQNQTSLRIQLVFSCSSLSLLVLLTFMARSVGAQSHAAWPPGLILTKGSLVSDNPEAAMDRVLVKFKEGRSVFSLRRIAGAKKLNVGHARKVGDSKWSLVNIETGMGLRDTIEEFRRDADVLCVEPDYVVHATEDSIENQMLSNDPQLAALWGLHNTGQNGGTFDADIDAPEAWESVTSSPVIVAVIDTGVDRNHPDLATNIWRNAREIANNGIDDDKNGYVDDVYGWDFAYNDNDPSDVYGHGTHVAGTIGAVGNNGLGVCGVCWNVKIMPCKFLSDSGSGYTSNAIRAVDYAVKMGATVLQNSWGGGSYNTALREAIARAEAAGVIFVASAGNDGANCDTTPKYPASYDNPNVIAVAATTSTDTLASFSNYGRTTIDLGAPGTSIYSTVPNNQYSTKSGTSMAAPHVSGACALLWAAAPNKTHLEIKNLIMSSVDPLPALAGKCVSGGRLNIGNAVGSFRPRGIHLLVPNGGEVLTVGAPVNIRWEISGQGWQAGDTVALEFSMNDGSTWQSVTGAGKIPYANCAFAWDTSSLFCGTQYLVRVTCSADPAVKDQSDATFTIMGSLDANVIDNTDNSLAKEFRVLSGNWPVSSNTSDCYGVNFASASVAATETGRVRWSAWDLTPGTYEVSAWWPENVHLTTRAPFVIKNGDKELDTIYADQSRNGGRFNLLDTFELDSAGLAIELNNGRVEGAAGTTIAADAIRFVLVSECIIDNRDNVSDRYFQVLSGNWNTNNGGSERWDPIDPQADYLWEYSSTGTETARAEWVSSSLPGGTYEVFAWWPVFAYSMGKNIPYEIHHAGGVTTVRVDQGIEGGKWNSLGTFVFDAGSHVVQLHNGQSAPGTYVVCDAVKFVRVNASTGMLAVVLEPKAACDAGAQWRVDQAEWHNSGDVVSGLSPGTHTVEYRIINGWIAPPAEQVEIISNQTLQQTSAYTQVVSECVIDNKDNGNVKYFRALSGYWNTNNGGTNRWAPEDSSADYRWEYVRPDSETARAEWVAANLSAGTWEVFAWWPVFTYSMGDNVPYEIHHANGVTTVRVDQGMNGGEWNSLGTFVFNAGSHVVQLHNGQSGPGVYVVCDAVKFVPVGGVADSLSVVLAPETACNAGAQWRVDGGAWRNSGEVVYGLSAGIHGVEYKVVEGWIAPSAEQAQIVENQALQLTREYAPMSTECIIDNKDTSATRRFRTISGTWSTNNGGAACWSPSDLSANYRWEYAQTGAETARAEWVCTDLSAGSYEVFAWWPVFAYSMGKNIAYEVHHASGATTVRVDQGAAGGKWTSLGTFTFNVGSHIVQIHNGQSGPGTYLVCDAIKFAPR